MLPPNSLTTQASAVGSPSLLHFRALGEDASFMHGVMPSDLRTPSSRANCSSSTGRKDPNDYKPMSETICELKDIPTPTTAKTSAPRPYEYHPRSSFSLVSLVSSPAYLGRLWGCPSSIAMYIWHWALLDSFYRSIVL